MSLLAPIDFLLPLPAWAVTETPLLVVVALRVTCAVKVDVKADVRRPKHARWRTNVGSEILAAGGRGV